MNLLVKLIISGRVQGVFFRRFVNIEANKLGISGFVRNLYSGGVEVQAFHHDRSTLEKFVNKCRQGSFGSNITNIKQDWINVKDKEFLFSEFKIERTI